MLNDMEKTVIGCMQFTGGRVLVKSVPSVSLVESFSVLPGFPHYESLRAKGIIEIVEHQGRQYYQLLWPFYPNEVTQ